MILSDDPGREEESPRQAPADAAGGFRRDLQRDERSPGHDPAARSAASRVPAARRRRQLDAARAARWASRRRCSGEQAKQLARVQPDARSPRLPARASRYPEIYEMQVRAIFEAACASREERGRQSRDHDSPRRHGDGIHGPGRHAGRSPRRLTRRAATKMPYLVGTMIEIPRAALLADGDRDRGRVLLVRHERPHADDVRLLARRHRHRSSPTTWRRESFRSIRSSRSTRTGSASSSTLGDEDGQSARAGSKSGSAASTAAIRPRSRFFHRTGLDYVSCSPYRVPIARLAAARAALSAGAVSSTA